MFGRAAPLAIGLAALIACTSPLPTATPTFGPNDSPPSQHPSAPAIGLAHFAAGGLSFDYPADWRVIAMDQDIGATFVPVVVGTGAWNDGCVRSANAVQCTGSHLAANPDELVAEFSYEGGPAFAVFPVPGVDSVVLTSGLAMSVEESPNGVRARIYVPAHRGFAVRVAWGDELDGRVRSDVDLMLASVSYSADASGGLNDLPEWRNAGDPRPCEQETLQGQLARGDSSGLNLSVPTNRGGYASLSWPSGWSASIGEGGRAELHDDSGALVAREWDEVRLRGRGDRNDFRVCPDAVEVVRAFPVGDL